MGKTLQNTELLIFGLGSDLANKKQIKSRAKRKLVTQVLAATLISIAERKGNDKLFKTFRNTYYCLDRLYVNSDRIHGNYCKNKICAVCNSIRKAEIINTYLPSISTWEGPHFLTLTVKSVPAKKLRAVMQSMLRGLKRIIEKYKKRNQRGGGLKLMGIRSLECDFNPHRKTYNPHFHIIINCKEAGEIIESEWLKTANAGWAYKNAQCLKRITNHEGSLVEIVKYGTKIFAEPDVTNKSKPEIKQKIYALALYTIIEAMQGIRLFDRFGFNAKKSNQTRKKGQETIKQIEEFLYDFGRSDWINMKSNLPLTEYKPEAKLAYLLENCIDTDLS